MFRQLAIRLSLLAFALSGHLHFARAQCTAIFEAGMLNPTYQASATAGGAQTFVPTTTGPVCEILHGVANYNGLPAYNLYIVDAPGTGAPPMNFASVNLFAALNQTSFRTTQQPWGRVAVTNGLVLTAGQRYALIIIPVGGSLAWVGNNGNLYPGGRSYFLFPSWLNAVPNDYTFRILGPQPPPNNDACNSCQTIGLGTTAGTTVGATTDGGSGCGGVNDVWFCFTATCSGPVTASICSPSFDSVLSVRTGCPGSEVVCNDDCPGTPCLGPGSCLTFNANCGVTYRIRVASFDGTTGAFTLTLSQPPPTPPANNAIAFAPLIPETTNLAFSTCGATTDGPPGCGALNDIWYRYTPSCLGSVTIDTCGSSFDTYLAVYTGTPGSLVLVPNTCIDDNGPACAGLQSSVRFNADPCTTYYVRVGGWAGSTGCGDLTIACTSGAVANDTCATAIPIGPGLVSGTTIGATASAPSSLTPAPCGSSSNTADVWYSFTPPCSGQLTLETCPAPCVGTRYDTVLSVYTGVCGNALNQVASACNDDASCGTGYFLSSRVVANVLAGVNYKIRVSGYAGHTGNFALQMSFAQPPLLNDSIANAIAIACGTTAFDTCGATTSPEPTGGCPIFNDVWYQFDTPNCGGTTTVATCGSLFDTSIAVYSGTAGAPVFVACNDNAPLGSPCSSTTRSYVSFVASANTTYFVRIGAPISGLTGSGIVSVGCPTAPPTCPPTTGGGLTSLFNLMGEASNTDWAFRLTIPCCFDLYVPVVAGVASSGNQDIDESNLRDRFVSALNTACPSLPPIATSYPHESTIGGIQGVTVWGKFGIKARHCGTNVKASLYVGPANTPPDELCLVTEGDLPVEGPCPFNPGIFAERGSGLDCNGNGEDDYVDILDGVSLDVNGDNVPDECGVAVEGPGLAYCAGDGIDPIVTTSCPCANFGALGNGCASSFNGNGAHITASGKASNDDVVLSGSGMQSTGICVFLQGSAIDPNAFVFGDGITCTGGSLIRLRGVALSGGSASFPVPPETITLSQRGGVVVGSGVERSYTVFYRNAAAAFCPPATFNTSNSYRIVW